MWICLEGYEWTSIYRKMVKTNWFLNTKVYHLSSFTMVLPWFYHQERWFTQQESLGRVPGVPGSRVDPIARGTGPAPSVWSLEKHVRCQCGKNTYYSISYFILLYHIIVYYIIFLLYYIILSYIILCYIIYVHTHILLCVCICYFTY